MQNSLMQTIRARRSVRTYLEKPLSPADAGAVMVFLNRTTEALGVPASFRLLDAKHMGLSSPVIVGAPFYAGIRIPKGDDMLLAAGYAMERFVLLCTERGIGTVLLAGTFDHAAFESAMEVGAEEQLPLITPVGYPAPKMSLRETMMRMGTHADERLPFETLFFRDDFSSPLSPSDAGVFADALEAVRLAPSAVNKQPWRVVLCNDTAHFFKKASKGMARVQELDLGIALAHLEAVLKAAGKAITIERDDPAFALPAGTTYCFSVRVS